MISQITESKDTKTPPSLGIRGAERCNPRNEIYLGETQPPNQRAYHAVYMAQLDLIMSQNDKICNIHLSYSVSRFSVPQAKKAQVFHRGVENCFTKQKPSVRSGFARTVCVSGGLLWLRSAGASQAFLDLPPAVGGQAAFVQVFVQGLPQPVWQREGEAVFEGGAALGNVKQAHDRARFFLVELPGGI